MMNLFNFGGRKSANGAGDAAAQSRSHVPSSVYSGPGPAEEEEDVPDTLYTPTPNGVRSTYQEDQPRYNPVRLLV